MNSTLGLWLHSTLVLWLYSTVDLLLDRTVDLWLYCTVDLWLYSTVDLWLDSTLVLWLDSTLGWWQDTALQLSWLHTECCPQVVQGSSPYIAPTPCLCTPPSASTLDAVVPSEPTPYYCAALPVASAIPGPCAVHACRVHPWCTGHEGVCALC